MNFRNKQEVKVGDRVKDRISGFSGIVTSITDYVAGCRRVGVSPEKLHNGEVIERGIFDEPNLQILEKAVFTSDNEAKPKIKLGDRVRDKISTMEGIATSITTYLSSDVYIGVTPTKVKDGKPLEGVNVPHQLVEVVKEQVEKEPPKGSRKTGGDQKIPRSVY
jgi:hypothetical protein